MSNRETSPLAAKALLLIVTMVAAVPSYGAETSILTNGWKCSAGELADADFNGGETARIRLAGYRRGDSYPVTFNADKTEAKGTTGNGTPFTCVKQTQN